MTTKKHMVLKEEDKQLLLHLHDFIYLDIAFIAEHIYKGYTGEHSFYRRLSKLEECGYVKAHMLQARDGDKRLSKVYTLTKFGVDEVFELRGLVHWRSEWSHNPPNSYKHQLLIADSVKSYQDQAEQNGLEVKEWVTEARAFYDFPLTNTSRKKSTAIRPDGILVLGRPDQENGYGFFIEMERSYSPKERTIRKIEQYNEFFNRREELMDSYKRKVAFDSDVNSFKIVFIGGTDAKAEKLLRDLAGETSALPILIAPRSAVESNPYGAIYRDTRKPEEYITL